MIEYTIPNSQHNYLLCSHPYGSPFRDYSDYEDAVKNKSYKTWLTIMDGHQRESHGHVNGTTISIDEEFVLDGGTCLFPRADTLPDEEICGCRCSLEFS